MSRARFAGLLGISLASLLASGCTTTKAATADEPRSPSSRPGMDPDPRAPGLALGAACEAKDTLHCGTKGRVAVVFEMRGGPPPPDQSPVACEMVRVQPAMVQPGGEHDGAQGCVKDERVYLSGMCLQCRSYSEWAMMGTVAEMTDAQLASAQERVGLSRAPLLRTPEHWRSALATAAKGPRRR